MITKEEWKIVVANELAKYDDKYDTLTILIAHDSTRTARTYGGDKKTIPTWRVNYKTTRGDWSTGFGTFEFDKDKADAIVREAKLNTLLKDEKTETKNV